MNPEFDDDQHLEEAFDAPDEPVAETHDHIASGQTGDQRVDAIVAPLGALTDLATADHVAVFDEVHRGLQDALGTFAEA